jgi:hypothetical protein
MRQGGGPYQEPQKNAVQGGIHDAAEPGEKVLPPALPLVITLLPIV